MHYRLHTSHQLVLREESLLFVLIIPKLQDD
jgi:hypothetical protein